MGFCSIHEFMLLLTWSSEQLPGVDFKIKLLTVGGKRLKLTIWDTGNELEYYFLSHPTFQASSLFYYVFCHSRFMIIFPFCVLTTHSLVKTRSGYIVWFVWSHSLFPFFELRMMTSHGGKWNINIELYNRKI